MWKSVASGDTQRHVRAAALDVARALAPPASARQASRRIRSREDAAAAALFFYYLDASEPGQGHDESALWWLTVCLSRQATHRSLALHGGFTQIAWVTTHLEGRLFDGGAEDLNSEFDDHLLSLLQQSRWSPGHDLVGGLAGFAIYFLERLPRPVAVRALGAIVDGLAALSRPVPDGITWYTPPDQLPRWQRQLAPGGYYNVGVAHGIVGVLAAVGGAKAAGVSVGVADRLLAGGMAWLLRQKLPGGSQSIFPSWVLENGASSAARLGWCYGDAGIAAVLLWLAKIAGEPTWEREALALARDVAARRPRKEIITEPGMCHGAAGMATMLARMYHLCGDPALAGAAVAWAELALSMRLPNGRGVGGFWSFKNTRSRVLADAGLIQGAAGTGLALLSLVAGVNPAWHRLFAISTASLDG